jgi:thiamine biosynthesis lipoprotein
MNPTGALPQTNFKSGLFKLKFRAMGTVCQVAYTSGSLREAEDFRGAALEFVRAFEKRYSRYDPESLVSAINLAAGLHPVGITPEDSVMFDLCESLHFITNGVFDPTALPLAKLWDFRTRKSAPSSSAIQKAKQQVGWDRVERKPDSLFLPEEGMALDLGGFGKEYAVDRVVGMARDAGISSALVDFGGDVFALGYPPDADNWRVGVEDFKNPGSPFCILGVVDLAVATSGNYLRSFESDGRLYGHIIDHRRGYPACDTQASATIVSGSCTEAGVLATCAIIDGPGDGLSRIEGVYGAEGCFRDSESLYTTNHFSNHAYKDES